MKKTAPFLTLLLILVVAVAILSITVLQRRDKPQAEPTRSIPTDVPETVSTPTSAPVSSSDLSLLTPTPEPTEEPVFETREPLESETPTPEPTPEATPEPLPADSSGSFRSNTGTGLNLVVDWKISSGKLQADVSVVSYSFFTSALYQSITLSVNGQNYSANSPAVSYDGKDLLTTPMTTFTVDAPAKGSSISVSWKYRGTYSGKELDTITASGTIS